MTINQFVTEATSYLDATLQAVNRSAFVRGVGKRAAAGLAAAQSAVIDGETAIPSGASRKRDGYWRVLDGKPGFVPGYRTTASVLPEDYRVQAPAVFGEHPDWNIERVLGSIASDSHTSIEAFTQVCAEAPSADVETKPSASAPSVAAVLASLK